MHAKLPLNQTPRLQCLAYTTMELGIPATGMLGARGQRQRVKGVHSQGHGCMWSHLFLAGWEGSGERFPHLYAVC